MIKKQFYRLVYPYQMSVYERLFLAILWSAIGNRERPELAELVYVG